MGPEAVGGDVRLHIQERLDVKERDRNFCFTYGGDAEGIDEQVSVILTGVNPELGQTLASTGLTVWRAAQELARFMWEHRRWFVGKNLVELGAGLGLCSVLASRLCVGGKVVVTDGGEEFTDLAMDALKHNLEKNSGELGLTPGQHLAPTDGAVRSANSMSACADPSGRGCAQIVLERLTWGNHDDFLERYAEGGNGDDGPLRRGFDFIVAADVLYEEEAVTPLLRTVVDILRLRYDPGGLCTQHPPDDDENQEQIYREPDQRSSQTTRVQGEQGKLDSFIGENEIGGTSANENTKSILPPRPQQQPSFSSIGLPWSPSVPTFLLAFARRNVSIDRVLHEAESLGLRWALPEDFIPSSPSENVYVMCLDDRDKCVYNEA